MPAAQLILTGGNLITLDRSRVRASVSSFCRKRPARKMADTPASGYALCPSRPCTSTSARQ